MEVIQSRIQGLLDSLTSGGREVGLQVAMYREGELVVDAWSGLANSETETNGDTLFPVFSVSKGIAATVIHRLVERGILSYDRPIAEVWPEFAAHGKDGITLRHALNHTAGIPLMPVGIGFRELADWETMCAAIADLEPISPPGERAEYHAITFGWIIGEIARRADGRSFSRLVQEEICQPLGTPDIHIGLREGVEATIAVLGREDTGEFVPPNNAKPQAIPDWLQPLHAVMNRPEMQRACLPATTGIMSARAAAKHYAALLPGGVDGVELLTPARMRIVREPPREPPGQWSKWTLGYSPIEDWPSSFGHSGYGGSVAFADPERKVAVALAKNYFNDLGNGKRILKELYAGV